jgi:hypothetical protein
MSAHYKTTITDRETTQDEFFTPFDFISSILDLDRIGSELYIDRNAGYGNWLCVIRDAKIANGIPRNEACSQLYATEYFVDNCIQLIENLYGPGDIRVLEKDDIPVNFRSLGVKACFEFNGTFLPNIIAADAVEYNFTFGEKLVFGNGLFEEN